MTLVPFPLPKADGLYSREMIEAREVLLEEFKDEKANPDLRRKLELLAKAFMLFAAQSTIEDNVRVQALQNIQRVRKNNERLLRVAQIKRLQNG